jgi:hypothetical protein
MRLFILYGFEICFLAIREKHKLQLFYSQELWKIFEPMVGEVNEESRKIDNEELRYLHRSLPLVKTVKSRKPCIELGWEGL